MMPLPAEVCEQRVRRIDAAVIRFPLHHPIRFGRARYEAREYLLSRIETDAGIHGFASALTRDTPLSAALEPIAARLVGQRIDDAFASLQALPFENVPGAPALVRARSVAENLLWDVAARAAGVPLARLIGTPTRTEVELTMVGGYLRDVRGDAAVLEEVESLVGAGFRRIKLMLDPDDPLRLREFLIHALERAGEASLSVDFHFAFDDLALAAEACDAIDDLGLAFIEDVFGPHRWRELADLGSRLSTPLAAGEDVVHPAAYRDLLEGARVLRVDPATCGGIRAALDGLRWAARLGRPILPHGSPFIGAQLAAITPEIESVEFAAPLDNGDGFADLCTGVTVEIVEGRLHIPTEPGADVALDWSRVVPLNRLMWSTTASTAV